MVQTNWSRHNKYYRHLGIPNAIPLVTHGAPQAEGSSVDANWVLVIDDATDVIAADFEDMATGLNHPVLWYDPDH